MSILFWAERDTAGDTTILTEKLLDTGAQVYTPSKVSGDFGAGALKSSSRERERCCQMIYIRSENELKKSQKNNRRSYDQILWDNVWKWGLKTVRQSLPNGVTFAKSKQIHRNDGNGEREIKEELCSTPNFLFLPFSRVEPRRLLSNNGSEAWIEKVHCNRILQKSEHVCQSGWYI